EAGEEELGLLAALGRLVGDHGRPGGRHDRAHGLLPGVRGRQGAQVLLPRPHRRGQLQRRHRVVPRGDRLAFTSNGGIGNYDLYVHELGGKTTRLTNHKEKDGQADWSPVADQLVFVSGRTGKGDLYLLDVASRGVTRLTWGTSPFLYPVWSPDGT